MPAVEAETADRQGFAAPDEFLRQPFPPALAVLGRGQLLDGVKEHRELDPQAEGIGRIERGELRDQRFEFPGEG